MHYKNNNHNNFAKNFRQIIATINLIAIAKFFDIPCTSIFQYLLNAKFEENDILGLMSISFEMIKTNSEKMLYLYYLV